MQNAKCKITIQNSKIIANKKIKDSYYKLLLKAPKIAKEAKPGQFVHIRLNNRCEPLLRRPFSIHKIKDSNIEILYEVVGRGTEILSEKKAGEYLDILGPLGNGFNYQLPITNYQLPILVAGGIGVAPLLFLAEKLRIYNLKPITVLLGAKIKERILCEEEFKALGCEVKISTDDGSKGFKGKVTDLLRHLLPPSTFHLPPIYACGSEEMLKEIAKITQRRKIPCQVSLDENMGCGLGACLGCAVKTKDGYKRVCKDGPIFNADEIVWEN